MPKIIRILNRFNLGGPTYNAAYLTKYLEPEFNTILVGGQKDDSEDSSEFILDTLGIKPMIIHEMKRSINPWNDWKAYRKIYQLIKIEKPTIVHTHASKAGALGRLAAIRLKVPIIIHTFHGHVFHSYFNPIKTSIYKGIERYLANRSTKIIAISVKQKKELCNEHRICPSDKIEVVPLGFDLKRFSENQEEKRQIFREHFSLESDEIAIGIVGRVVPVKNHQLFLKAIQFVTENTTKKIKAFIIGDGESIISIKEHASALGIRYSDQKGLTLFDEHISGKNNIMPENQNSGNLVFTSWIRNIDYAFAGLDIIALSSLNEGTPVSIIEAQAASKPVVSTPVGGVENIVIPGETALLSNGTDQSYFDCLLDVTENEDRRISMGKSGWDHVNNKYNYNHMTGNFANLYQRLMQSL